MNASAIYSKSGKGVQEASGKTSNLARSDRAVLSAIDGRATLADVAQKVGKAFDSAFERLIESLDKGGYIREVSAGVAGPAPASGKGAGAKPAPTAPMDASSDLDFTTVLSMPRGKPAPPASKTKPTHTAPVPPPPPPPSAAEKAQAAKSAKEQQDAFARAREEAERKAAAERERVKAEAEAKMREEAAVKLRAEAEAKLKAQAEAKAKADAEAKVREAKAKAEAEAKIAREEAERVRREAEEMAARARREAEEKARREHDELKRKLDEERRAREEAERRAKEEAKQLEEERRKLEAERKARDEERRREEEERVQRRIQDERERVERKRQRAEEAEEDEKRKPKEKEPEPELVAPRPAAGGGAFSDTLLADLASFTTRDEEAQKERDEAARKESEAAAARMREVEEQRQKEEVERRALEEKRRRKQEEAERRARDEAELRAFEERERQRLREEEETRKREAEEREKKAKQEESIAAKATRSGLFDAEQRAKRERTLMKRGKGAAAARVERKTWGKPIALTLFLLLLIGLGVVHVMPIDTSEYERAATEALGRPVKIGSANLWLVTGPQVRFNEVNLGEGVSIPQMRAFPAYDALIGQRKAFSRIEIDRLKIEQEALGQALFAKLKSDTFEVERIVLKNVEFTGPLALPKGLEFEVIYDPEGRVRAALVRGPEALSAKLTSRASGVDVDMSAASFTLPFAPEIVLSRFALKGTATQQGLAVSEWDGALLNGSVSGTANVRWGESWAVDGVVTARNINAAVFAPALLSDGKGEGSGKFSMRGRPGKLASSSRLDGSFTVTRGVLGSIDLSRAIQTGGKQATGRTQFNEMNGQAVYDRGAVALRNVTIGAGQLNAGASADISQSGTLSGRIVADVRVASQQLRATLNLGGTVKEPLVNH